MKRKRICGTGYQVGWFVPVLGVGEVASGLGLASRVGMRLVPARMLGTFLVGPLLRDLAFPDGKPLLLTTEGELVLKNLAARCWLGGRIRVRESGEDIRCGSGVSPGASNQEAAR